MSERGKSGIYAITNMINGKRYVGQAASIGDRWLTHKSHLKCDRHHSQHLQHAWNKHGVEAFRFEVLEYVARDKERLAEREQFYFDTLKPEYNIAPAAGSNLGLKRGPHSPETIAKIKATRAGFRHSPETVEKLKAIAEQKRADGSMYRPTPEHREKLRAENIGKPKSAQTIERRLASVAWYRPTEETIAKRAAANTGKKRTPEQCARIAAAKVGHGLGRKQSRETIERRADSLRGKARPQSVIDRMHEALRLSREPQIQKIIAALKDEPDLNITHLANTLHCGRATIRKYRDLLATKGELA
jgi:group I intron endonuclease